MVHRGTVDPDGRRNFGQPAHGVLEHLVELVRGGHRSPRIRALIHVRFEDVVGDRGGALEDEFQDAGERSSGVIDDQARVDHHNSATGRVAAIRNARVPPMESPAMTTTSHSSASSR